MNNNFEQQFIQNVQSQSQSQTPAPQPSRGSKPKLHPAIIAAIVVLSVVQLATLIFSLLAFINVSAIYEGYFAEDSYADDDSAGYSTYVYADDGSIQSMSSACVADNGYELYFSHDQSYELWSDAVSVDDPVDFGEYSFASDSSINLQPNSESSSTSRTVQFTDDSIIDGDTTYNCDTDDQSGTGSEE